MKKCDWLWLVWLRLRRLRDGLSLHGWVARSCTIATTLLTEIAHANYFVFLNSYKSISRAIFVLPARGSRQKIIYHDYHFLPMARNKKKLDFSGFQRFGYAGKQVTLRERTRTTAGTCSRFFFGAHSATNLVQFSNVALPLSRQRKLLEGKLKWFGFENCSSETELSWFCYYFFVESRGLLDRIRLIVRNMRSADPILTYHRNSQMPSFYSIS